jgi:hypothetical protein
MNREDIPLPPHGVPPKREELLMPCTRCGESTEHSTLRMYGARCFRCFLAYCREPQLPQKLFVRREKLVSEDAE